MLKKNLRSKAVLVLTMMFPLFISCIPARADNNQAVQKNHDNYSGEIVKSLPPGYTTIVIDNTRYYYNNALYFMKLPDDTYVVVPDPHIK